MSIEQMNPKVHRGSPGVLQMSWSCHGGGVRAVGGGALQEIRLTRAEFL